MIKACSFLPAVSQMIYDMGLQQHLLGVTFECPEIARKEKYKVLNSVFENHSFSSKAIDEIFSSYKNEGTIIYSMDEQRLLQINPDVVFTQDLCDVCMIDTHSVEKLIHAHQLSTEIVSMSPNNMDE
jgi:iron complex transport system substrate-binding protein